MNNPVPHFNQPSRPTSPSSPSSPSTSTSQPSSSGRSLFQMVRDNYPDYDDDEVDDMVRGILSRARPDINPLRGVAEREHMRAVTDFQRLQHRAATRQQMSMLPFMQSLVTVGPPVKIHPFDSGERDMAAHENPKLPAID